VGGGGRARSKYVQSWVNMKLGPSSATDVHGER
jgi:hypothetical protein